MKLEKKELYFIRDTHVMYCISVLEVRIGKEKDIYFFQVNIFIGLEYLCEDSEYLGHILYLLAKCID